MAGAPKGVRASVRLGFSKQEAAAKDRPDAEDRVSAKRVDRRKLALHGPVDQGDVEEVTRLLSLRADVGLADSHGRRALHTAAAADHAQLIDVLVKARADLEAKDHVGQTPLHFASSAGCVERLCALGARLEAGDASGAAPLHVVLRYGHWQAAEALLRRRANAAARDGLGRNVLHVAAAWSAEGLRELLASRSSELRPLVRAADRWGRAPLHAASSGEAAACLLDHGASVDARDGAGCSPLLKACASGHAGAAAELLRRGANIATKDESSCRALHYAAMHGHVDVVRLLLKHAAKPELVNGGGFTALHFAAYGGHDDVLAELLQGSADPWRPSPSGRPLLALAVRAGDASAARRLLALRADAAAKDSDGLTALELARRWNLVDVAECLEQGLQA